MLIYKKKIVGKAQQGTVLAYQSKIDNINAKRDKIAFKIKNGYDKPVFKEPSKIYATPPPLTSNQKYMKEREERINKIKSIQSGVGKVLDVGTDIMQLGNFIPHPAAQTIGKIGGGLGAAIDISQSYNNVRDGDYVNGSINLASAMLPLSIRAAKRNSKFIPPTSLLYGLQKKIPGYDSSIHGFERISYVGLANNSNTASVIKNRALFGGLLSETLYDLKDNNK